MEKKRFPLDQITGVRKQAEMGIPAAEVIQPVGIPELTVYDSLA